MKINQAKYHDQSQCDTFKTLGDPCWYCIPGSNLAPSDFVTDQAVIWITPYQNDSGQRIEVKARVITSGDKMVRIQPEGLKACKTYARNLKAV